MQFAKFLELILQKETVLKCLLLATVNTEMFWNIYVAGGDCFHISSVFYLIRLPLGSA